MRPGAVGLVALVEDEIVRRFQFVEPLGRLAVDAGVKDRSPRSHLYQGLDQRVRHVAVLKAALQGNNREGLWPHNLATAAGRFAQAARHDLQKIEHDTGIARHQHFKGFRTQTQQFGVAQGNQSGRMRPAGQKRHLADGLSRRDRGHQTPWSAIFLNKDAKTAGHHQKQCPVVLAVARQLRAAWKTEPIGLGHQAPKRRFAHIVQQAKAAQPRP